MSSIEDDTIINEVNPEPPKEETQEEELCSQEVESCCFLGPFKPNGEVQEAPPSITPQESDIGLQWLKLGGASSTMLDGNGNSVLEEAPMQVEIYQTAYDLEATSMQQNDSNEPQQTATINGILKSNPSTSVSVVIISDDDDSQSKDNMDNYESADEHQELDEGELGTQAALPAIDSHFCARKGSKRRSRVSIEKTSQVAGMKSTICFAGTSSDCSEAPPSQKLKINTQPQNSFKQRQLELHRHRIAVEQKRLDLLELKMARERDEMLREALLFEREMELKSAHIRKINEDRLELEG